MLCWQNKSFTALLSGKKYNIGSTNMFTLQKFGYFREDAIDPKDFKRWLIQAYFLQIFFLNSTS